MFGMLLFWLGFFGVFNLICGNYAVAILDISAGIVLCIAKVHSSIANGEDL